MLLQEHTCTQLAIQYLLRITLWCLRLVEAVCKTCVIFIDVFNFTWSHGSGAKRTLRIHKDLLQVSSSIIYNVPRGKEMYSVKQPLLATVICNKSGGGSGKSPTKTQVLLNHLENSNSKLFSHKRSRKVEVPNGFPKCLFSHILALG